jgi:NADPH:quinone reductase-like Zn-dependent oxidoreductase
MKKVVYDRYGGADELKLINAEKPVPGAKQVLIRMKAAAINPIDWKLRNGEMKLFTGWKFPKGIGFDFAGTVERVGASAGEFQIGDSVFGTIAGFTGGALADFIAVDHNTTMSKPDEISFEQATAFSMTGATALRILEDIAKVRKGTEILINGASGGVGMFTTQIAKRKGAIVTAVAGPRGQAALKQWGADHIVDYSQVDILQQGVLYDVVVDLSDKLPFKSAIRIMKDKSIYVNAIPTPPQIIASKISSVLASKKNKALVTIVNKKDLQTLAAYASDGLDIKVGETFPLASVVEGFKAAEQGRTLGKTVFVFG